MGRDGENRAMRLADQIRKDSSNGVIGKGCVVLGAGHDHSSLAFTRKLKDLLRDTALGSPELNSFRQVKLTRNEGM